MDSVATRILTWKSGLLTHAGRVLLTKVTLSAIPVHFSIVCCLSAWAIQQIDKRRRAFLWAGSESVSGGKCKVAWTTVCRPTGLRGLGIVDLRFFGYALRLRWQWLGRTAPDSCWAKLSVKPERHVADMALISMSVVLGDGRSARFWMDSWEEEECKGRHLRKPMGTGCRRGAHNTTDLPIPPGLGYCAIRGA